MLDAAEYLFSKHGLEPVKIKHIADRMGKSQALVYHHFPGGKEELYVAVHARMLDRFRDGLERARHAEQESMLAQLRSVAAFMLSQPPMDLARMASTDMPALNEEHSAALSALAYQSLFGPLIAMFTEWHVRGAITGSPRMLAGMFLAIVDSARNIPEMYLGNRSRQALADEMIDVMYRGIKA